METLNAAVLGELQSFMNADEFIEFMDEAHQKLHQQAPVLLTCIADQHWDEARRLAVEATPGGCGHVLGEIETRHGREGCRLALQRGQAGFRPQPQAILRLVQRPRRKQARPRERFGQHDGARAKREAPRRRIRLAQQHRPQPEGLRAQGKAVAKAQPQALNYATSGNGTVAHLATEMFQRTASIKLTHVPYKGASQGLTDVIGGQVQLYMSSVPTLIGHIKSGKLRALAVTSAQRVDDLPQVPTVAESGYKGFEAVTWFGLLGPAKLPAPVVSAVNAELNKALTSPELRKKLEDQGLEVRTSTPEQFGQLIRSDIDKWGRVVKASGARAD